MKKYLFEYKHESCGDEWQEYESKWGPDCIEDVAYELAENYYNEEPCDPYKFEFVVEVKQFGAYLSKKFRVSAEADVNFYPREIEDEPNQEG